MYANSIKLEGPPGDLITSLLLVQRGQDLPNHCSSPVDGLTKLDTTCTPSVTAPLFSAALFDLCSLHQILTSNMLVVS